VGVILIFFTYPSIPHNTTERRSRASTAIPSVRTAIPIHFCSSIFPFLTPFLLPSLSPSLPPAHLSFSVSLFFPFSPFPFLLPFLPPALHPTADAHTYLAYLFSYEGAFEEAKEGVREAMTVDGEFGNAWNDLGLVRREGGREGGAEKGREGRTEEEGENWGGSFVIILLPHALIFPSHVLSLPPSLRPSFLPSPPFSTYGRKGPTKRR